MAAPDADSPARRVRPGLLQQGRQPFLACRLGDVAGYHDIVDHEPAVIPAKRNELGFDAVSLAIEAEEQQQRAGRNRAARIAGLRGAIAELFPGRRFARGLVGLASRVIEKGLLGLGIALGPQPFPRDALEGLQIGIGRPDPERAMLALCRGIVRAKLQPFQHLPPMMLLDRATAGDACEVRLFRLGRIERGMHVLPFQDLHLVAVRARDVRKLLAARLEALGYPAARQHQRRRGFQDLRELMGTRSAVRLRFRIASRVHLPLRQIVLHLAAHGDLRQR